MFGFTSLLLCAVHQRLAFWQLQSLRNIRSVCCICIWRPVMRNGLMNKAKWTVFAVPELNTNACIAKKKWFRAALKCTVAPAAYICKYKSNDNSLCKYYDDIVQSYQKWTSCLLLFFINTPFKLRCQLEFLNVLEKYKCTIIFKCICH